jgi:dihydroorotase
MVDPLSGDMFIVVKDGSGESPVFRAAAPLSADGTITLERSTWTAPEEIKIDGPDGRALVYRGGEQIEWRVTDTGS